MQDVLRRYIQSVNSCDEAGAKSAVTSDFATRYSWTPAFSARLLPTAGMCGPGQPSFEVSVLARTLRAVTDDVTMADAFFRTIGVPNGDEAGRLYITFVRRDGAWRIFSLRFHPVRFEKPFFGIEPATHHDPSGPDGWLNLFDGTSRNAFQDATGGAFPSSWTIDGDALKAVAGKNGRALRTKDTYRSFELRFDWKTGPKGNSGIKYRLFYLAENPRGGSDGAGLEYQVADDGGDPGAIRFAVERSGALYNQFAPRGAVPKPLGEYNQSVLIVRGRHCEHWLNGVKVVEFAAESNPPESPIMLQHHGTEVWFRNIRIRRID